MRRAFPWRSLAGRWLLNAYFASDGRLSQREVAAQLGTTEQVVHSWKTGARRPNFENAEGLERLIGIPRDKWRTRAELRKLGRLRALGGAGAMDLRGIGHGIAPLDRGQ